MSAVSDAVRDTMRQTADISSGTVTPIRPAYRELLLGCGPRRVKKMGPPGKRQWSNLTAIDMEECHKPDILHDLNVLPWPLESDAYDEVHAYEVLEHIGQQGDFRAFFAQFMEIWRILKPGGCLYATCPSPDSRWVWGDPGHTRAMTLESMTFLQQPEYTKQVGTTAMSDYRAYFTGDFDSLRLHDDGTTLQIILKAVKPSRISI